MVVTVEVVWLRAVGSTEAACWSLLTSKPVAFEGGGTGFAGVAAAAKVERRGTLLGFAVVAAASSVDGGRTVAGVVVVAADIVAGVPFGSVAVVAAGIVDGVAAGIVAGFPAGIVDGVGPPSTPPPPL